mmetsp:Transcript_17821/g.29186  ORF Transcript_17821/g.29186 Transcript_17821/m.29186 type:complete len:120 (+) Transcript_17821:703-1062(+)
MVGIIRWSKGSAESLRRSKLPNGDSSNRKTRICSSYIGISAAIAASILTQPLDTIKTRMQVANGKPVFFSPVSVAKELASTSGLFKGLLPRIGHMGVWGSVLSAAYEYLKFVSRKDYNT